MNPAEWRRGDFATIAGRTFPVRYERRAWREVGDDGRFTGAAHQREELDRLFSYYYLADLDGVEVGVEDISDGVARVSTLAATPDLVERWSMHGNQRDGWVTTVPLTSLSNLREQILERDTP